MFKAKSLIYLSFILAFAVGLQNGDQVAFMTDGNHFAAQYQYLNAGTVDGSVSMAANTDYASASGTWWEAQLLSDGSWAFASLGNIPNDQHIFLNANTYTGAVDLAGSTNYATTSGTHWNIVTLVPAGGSSLVDEAALAAIGAVNSAVGAASGAVNSAVGAASGAVNGAVGAATGAVNSAVGAASGAVNSAVGAATGAVNSVSTAIDGAVGSIGSALSSIF
jgi:hypothetical protein